MFSCGGQGGGSLVTGRSKESFNRNYLSYMNGFASPTQHFKMRSNVFNDMNGFVPPTLHFKTLSRAFLVGETCFPAAGREEVRS